MDKFEYVPAALGASTVKMDGPRAFAGTAEGVRSREWVYEIGKRDLVSTARTVREAEVDFVTDFETADALREAADADMLARTPGTFVAQGEWRQRGYVTAQEVQGVHYGWLRSKLTIALLDGAWWRLRGVSLLPDESLGADGLDYPHDFDYDYSEPTMARDVNTGKYAPCKPRIVFYGPVTNPEISIAGNLYKVSGSVAAGARIEVDGREMTVKMIAGNGDVTDMFADAERGSGEGGGSYIFQPIPPGDNAVTWDGTFGVDVGWYDEVGEPPWSQS